MTFFSCSTVNLCSMAMQRLWMISEQGLPRRWAPATSGLVYTTPGMAEYDIASMRPRMVLTATSPSRLAVWASTRARPQSRKRNVRIKPDRTARLYFLCGFLGGDQDDTDVISVGVFPVHFAGPSLEDCYGFDVGRLD